MTEQDSTIRVTLFGSLSTAVQGGEFEVEVSKQSTVGDLRRAIFERLEDNPLLNSCAIASSDRVLQDSEVLGQISQIAVLPPVCGG